MIVNVKRKILIVVAVFNVRYVIFFIKGQIIYNVVIVIVLTVHGKNGKNFTNKVITVVLKKTIFYFPCKVKNVKNTSISKGRYSRFQNRYYKDKERE